MFATDTEAHVDHEPIQAPESLKQADLLQKLEDMFDDPETGEVFRLNNYHAIIRGAGAEILPSWFASHGWVGKFVFRSRDRDLLFMRPDDYISEKEGILGIDQARTRGLAELPLDILTGDELERRDSITALFSVDVETLKESIGGTFEGYVEPSEIQFEGLAYRPSSLSEKRRVLLSNDGPIHSTTDDPEVKQFVLSPEKVEELVSQNATFEIPLSVEEAVQGIDTLTKDKLSEEQRFLLIKAIRSYATLMKHEPEKGFHDDGACFTVPNAFVKWAESIGVEGMRTVEFTSNLGPYPQRYHQANIIEGVVVDWTARQYTKKGNYPFVYPLAAHENWYQGINKIRINSNGVGNKPVHYLVGKRGALHEATRHQYHSRDNLTLGQSLSTEDPAKLKKLKRSNRAPHGHY